ncbi:MAG: YdcF family protein [Clostridia bacterium]|nr:YdcF family protein [Clostridia bacterium]
MRHKPSSTAPRSKLSKRHCPVVKRKRKQYKDKRHLPLLCIIAITLAALILTLCITLAIVNDIVKSGADDRLYQTTALPPQADCIFVLGAGVREDGTPSDMLRDRILQGVALYHAGCAPVIIMSGDSEHPESYDEVGVMKEYAIAQGVPAEAILTDPLGLSTAKSMVNLAAAGEYDSIIIVSQEYHLYRAIYLAEQLGLDAVGSSADHHTYRGQWYRDLRELAARCKDFFLAPQP